VSEFDSADLSPSSARYTEELNKELGEVLGKQFEPSPKAVEREREREGLPSSYRMRADAHYVEQLMSRSPDTTVRSIALDEIESESPAETDGLHTLAQSIAAHGVVHPLLVRRREGDGYRLIAGRRRLAAARMARLARVPCLIHQVDEEEGALLARADNLRGRDDAALMSPAPQRDSDGAPWPHLSETLSTIQSALGMLTSRGTAMSHKVALELLTAETRRAAWQVRAAEILEQRPSSQLRRAVVGPLVTRVCEGFAAEARLKGIELMPEIPDWNVSAAIDEELFGCALSGAVLATMALVEQADRRTVAVAVRASADSSAGVDVTQNGTSLPGGGAGRFFDRSWIERPGGWSAALGAAVAKAVAERHGGDAILIAREGRGSTIRLTFGR
jgi:hypothetical protein